MALNFRPDTDLELLQSVGEADLRTLARYMTHDSDNKERRTSELLAQKDFMALDGDPLQYSKSWKLIAAELQYFGGDTAINMVRRTGVLYSELLTDVAKHIGVKSIKNKTVKEIELELIGHVLGDAWSKMDEAQRLELLTSIGINVAPALGLAAIQAAIKTGGFAAYKLAAIVANAVARTLLGKGLTFAATGVMMRGISLFAGPVGWAVTALFALPAVTGPAYRVTVPAVLHIAYLRLSADVTAEAAL
ncbi:MAG TPA: DUF3944 domain-containing protein [Eoetvoesiella sp.]